MNDSNGGRALFQSLRVPFDLKAVLLAFVALIVTWGVDSAILGPWYKSRAIDETVTKVYKDKEDSDAAKEFRSDLEDRLPSHGSRAVLTELSRRLGVGIPQFRGSAYQVDGFPFVIGLILLYLIYAFFGGAIARVVASRIARDESIGFREALSFSISSWKDYLLAPLFVVIAIGFFWLCNMLAGTVASVPFIGPILNLALFPLVILSSLIITLIAFGGLLGLDLMIAAIAVERNGSLDAISRAFSYVYARPVQYFFYKAMIGFFAIIIMIVGNGLLDVTRASFDDGIWSTATEEAVAPNAKLGAELAIEGHGFDGLNGGWVWLMTKLLTWGIHAYVLFYVIGGMTAVYFLLRREVDGTEESEIFLTDADEDEFDFSVKEVPAPDASATEEAATTASEEPAAEEPAAEEPEPASEEPAEAEAVEEPETEDADANDGDSDEESSETDASGDEKKSDD